jgi:hypothetical protein
MKYFPRPEELSDQELRDLYRLKRFNEWKSFLSVVVKGAQRTQKQIVDESIVAANVNIMLRDIGALAFMAELKEFMEGAEEYLKLLSGKGGTQNERNERTF